MSGGGGQVYPLKDEQAKAVDPADSVWLSASAGTGKTQVLSARVLRLLLQPGVAPGQILGLTFTKAGAAEMATRVNAVLARWVRLPETRLAKDLMAIGAPHDQATIARARTLFASVLDCPGGGLRIDTIHAFAQWLLAAFPEEAGLMAGTRPMEDRDRDLLAHQVLADLLVAAEESGDGALMDSLAALSLRLGPDGVRAWLMRCANMREAWFGAGAWQPPMAGRVRSLLGLDGAEEDEEAALAALCADDRFDCAALRRCVAAARGWGAATGQDMADAVEDWLAGDPPARNAGCSALYDALFTQAGAPRSLKSLAKIDPDYAAHAEAVMAALLAIEERRALGELAQFLTPALELGRRFALAWDEAKRREGLIDFDDLIRRAAALLIRSDLSAWIRYKLDREFDHLLIDEAQDTNEAQWQIINALTEEFYAGEGQRGDRLRTVFVVGDYKQAIFRFQGTSPENFRRAGDQYRDLMRAARQAAAEARANTLPRELVDLGLGRSYRTAQVVLDFVDEALGAIGHEAIGLATKPDAHKGDERPGQVVLWEPVSAHSEEPEAAAADDENQSNWLSEPERRLADRIARQVRQWLDNGFPLVKGRERLAGPGDIMVLVRKRKELAGLIVARLHAAGVPVAGVDRLRLAAPLAVRDLIAALGFAAQPWDDLTLANLLVSPLIGWTQDDLLTHGWRDQPHQRLWEHLQGSDAPLVTETVARLGELLRLADFEPPQALLHWLLVGPWQGRRKLVARLGREANDPIDELLNAAMAFAATNTPSLHGFLRWFAGGDGELKREAEGAGDLVRVMTVHGAKGLQAPIVILADATGNPDSSRTRGLTLPDQPPGAEAARRIPLPPLAKEHKVGPVAASEEAERKAEREEHWRLLYVAMTRAEEALFVGGALGKREQVPAADSWYARLRPLMAGEGEPDFIWGRTWRRGDGAPLTAELSASRAAGKPTEATALPGWATHPVGAEPRPPRPLAPSAVGADQAPDPPLPADALKSAARRGVLIHALLERLPAIDAAERQSLAAAWLARQAGELDPAERSEVLGAALGVLAQPAWAALFGPDALAEVPLAATVEGQVIAGTADRLLVEPERVMVVDFKTTRRPPRTLAEVPAATVRQMAAYAAALRAIYPGRAVRAALLYTHTPLLIELPPDALHWSVSH